MHKFLATIFAGALTVISGTANAQTSGVVVELFTSQGCSSCPPADAFLGELTSRDDVIPLAFHVTYWDRLGWKDTFGDDAFTNRQYAYGKQFRKRSVWTPQFIIQGQDYSRNKFRKMVGSSIAKHGASTPSVTMKAVEVGGQVELSLAPTAGAIGPLVVSVVHYSPRQQVAIKRGENAGKNITYHNVVTQIYDVGKWDGRTAHSLKFTPQTGRPFVILIQGEKAGPIHSAALFR